MSDVESKPEPIKPVRVSSAYAPAPPSAAFTNGGGSLPNMPPSSLAATDDEDDDLEFMVLPQVITLITS